MRIELVQLALFIVLWAAVLIGLGILIQRRSGARHELDPAVWLARSIAGGLFALLLVFGPYEGSHALSPFLNGLNFFPFLVLTPFQTLVDPIGAFILHSKGRHRLEQLFTFNFPVILPYLTLPLLLVYEYFASRRERLARLRLEEFTVSLPPWIWLTLVSLSRYGWAKRRRDLKLTCKRSRILAEMGLAQENEQGTLTITQLGREVADIVATREGEGIRGR